MRNKVWMEGYRTGKAFHDKWMELCKERRKKKELELKPKIRGEKHAASLSRMKETEIVERQNKAGGTKNSSTLQLMIKNGKFEMKEKRDDKTWKNIPTVRTAGRLKN